MSDVAPVLGTPASRSSHAYGETDRLVRLADTLAGAWARRAATSTTLGQERALLRMLGVTGLDREGRPLAAEVVERYIGSSPARLASGVLLPFTMALLEYDLAPQDLALDVASGAIDLALEADLLNDPERRVAAEQEATRLARSAMDRIDANRIARRELLDLLGDTARPWFGMTLAESEVTKAAAEAVALIDAGADLIRVIVPAGRELSLRAQVVDEPPASRNTSGLGADFEPLANVGLGLGARFRRGALSRFRPSMEGVPAGSQRGIGELRHALDEAGAERRRYVRMSTVGPALSAPEAAVVAAFERVDVVEVDPMAEVVHDGVDPDRALADHSFASRLVRRSGSLVFVGPGPLVVGPDLARGVPSDPATRAGRAIALQLLGVALARRHGLASDQILIDALPPWINDERDPTVQAIAQVAIRRVLFPDHALVFDEPPQSAAAEGWPFVFAAAVPGSEPTALILRRGERDRARQIGEATRAAVRVGREVGAALGSRSLHGAALDHARAAVEAAGALLDGLANEGWRAVVGAPMDESERTQRGWDTVVERADEFDPFALDGPIAGR